MSKTTVVQDSGGRDVSPPPVVRASGVIRRQPKLLLLALAMLVGAAVPASAAATTFYVSPSGHDWSSGKSPARAWLTVGRVNESHLRPGDVVLFKTGSTFSDDALMPGWGTAVSGRRGAPVVFGTYGAGRATLSQGIWVNGEHNLNFQDLNLGPDDAVSGTGYDNTVQECTMSNLTGGKTEIAIDVIGSHWIIRNNSIDGTGDSGMLLRGDHFLVVGNRISNTGLDPRITYGSHGVYLKAFDSKVIGNVITHFRNDGVSVRYRNSVVKDNTISGGDFGIAWFQYDSKRGTSRWIDNTISFTRIAGIYVSPSDIGGTTHENFVIRGNTIYRPAARRARVADLGGWSALSLSHNHGRYRVRGNHSA